MSEAQSETTEPTAVETEEASGPPTEEAVREVCDRHGVLFIADEVMTGAGRTGTFLRVEAFGVVPDMVIMAKAISGGAAQWTIAITSGRAR
mgnify:CR=1 FL=1